MRPTPPVIAFKAVTKRFDKKIILRNLSYSIPGGEALCIMGKSGSGKTVILKLLIGLLKPDSGNICVNGEDIVLLGPQGISRVQRNMGFMSKNAALLDCYSLYDNLAMPLHQYTMKSNNEIAGEVEDLLSGFGLVADRKKLPIELSGAMRKRAGLACALVFKPTILLVDEPTTGLDRVAAAEIDHLLLEIKERADTTMIVVTHDNRGVQRLGGRVLVLDQGNILAIGTLAELKESAQETVRRLIKGSLC